MRHHQHGLMLVLLLLASPALQADELAPFTSDGCSVFPDGTAQQQSLWARCCIAHDLAYWKGGTQAEREAADHELQRCVSAVGEPGVADLMLAGVRVGGSPHWPTSFRWGYGWPWGRGYTPLTESDKAQVGERLRQLELLLNTLQQTLDTAQPNPRKDGRPAALQTD